jgi:hypothetical protein
MHDLGAVSSSSAAKEQNGSSQFLGLQIYVLNTWNVSEYHGTSLYLQRASCKTYLTDHIYYLNGYAIRYNLKLCILEIETNIERE